MKKLILHICWVAMVLLFSLNSCTSSKLKTPDNNYRYDNKIKDLDPSMLVYHVNDTLSYLYIEVLTKNLLYVRENSSTPFEAEVKISYEIYNDYRAKELLDSATKVLYDYKNSIGDKKILSRIPLSIPFGMQPVLKVVSYDVNKKVKSETVIEIDKKDKFSNQFFLFKNRLNNEVCFDYFHTMDNDLEIESVYNANETFDVDYFNTQYPASSPPFSKNRKIQIAESLDSNFMLNFSGGKANLLLDKKGSFYIKPFDSLSYSLVLQRLDSNFSEFHSYIGMIEPLKYICTSSEYKNLVNSPNQRKAVEDLWLKMAGTKERARTVIHEYYRRVELANKFFTSYKEGWKTDRGMLSIVLGLPNTIYKTRGGETWVYGSPNNMMMSLTFSFNKENIEKTDNDYQLIRYRTYREYWYRACENWRKGRVYNFN